jgi:hypothetical protein
MLAADRFCTIRWRQTAFYGTLNHPTPLLQLQGEDSIVLCKQSAPLACAAAHVLPCEEKEDIVFTCTQAN